MTQTKKGQSSESHRACTDGRVVMDFDKVKAFNDWDISDFKDMGSLAHHHIQKGHISFNGFVKAIEGEPRPQHRDYPTSKLADVL